VPPFFRSDLGGVTVRVLPIVLLASAAFPLDQASASDVLKFGAAPSWVRPQAIPAAKATEAPISLLLSDQQIAFERGKTSTYSEGAIKIENSQGLAAGNLALVWDPSTETVTVNKLQIRRGNQVIDVLAGGQSFTTLRRETNLDAAMLDGTLTATIQPEGLQVGDIIDLATTTERSDPVLKGHVESMFASWGALPIRSAHAVLRWPNDVHLQFRATPNLPAAQKSTSAGINVLDLSAENVEPLVPPKGAPTRFKIGRLAEATDFATWADLADLMIPLYRDASVIPASGPLHDEVEKIRAGSTEPKARAQAALSLVQDRVRYVALLMGQGGYVPASAETTWSRRFGDCKAKTALLIAVLHSLGIQAEPVLVQAGLGDMIADRVPMIGLFNHVLVRAHVGAKDYWLDGTRTGDTDLDSIEVPDFGWGLPVVAGSKLVQMVPAPLAAPSLERHVSIDASGGVYAAAPITIDEIYRGDSAVAMNAAYSAVTGAQRDQALHDEAKSFFDDFGSGSSSVQFDQKKREFHMSIKGTAKLNWKDGWFYVPTASIGFDPDFDRPAGPFHDVPVEINHPRYTKDEAAIRLPPGFATSQKLDPPVHETLAGVEYARTEMVNGDAIIVDSSERSIAPEVTYKDALAAVPRLRTLDKDDTSLSVPGNYAFTQKDVAELQSRQAVSAMDYFLLAAAYLSQRNMDQALVNLNAGLAIDSKDVWALRSRAGIFLMKQRPEEARHDVEAGLAVRPHDNELLLLKATMGAAGGSMDSGIEGISKLLKDDPKNPDALIQRAWLLNGKNDRDGALRDLSAVINDDPKNVRALAGRAMVYAGKRDFTAADHDLTAAEAIDATNPMVASAKAEVARWRNDLPAAIAAIETQIAANPRDGNAYASRAQTYFASNKYELALKDSDKAMELGFTSPQLRLLRANIYMRQGNHSAVAHEADLLMQENPTSNFAFVAAARSFAAIGQNDRAMQAFDRALAIKADAYVYINRSQIRPKTDVKGRLADLDTALKAEPHNFDALYVKSEVLRDSGDYAGALATLDAIDAGDQPKLRAQRAFLLYKSGHADEATKMFEAIRSSTTDPSELNNLCYDKAIAGIMLESALQDCNDALKLSPNNPGFEDSLGMVYLKLGKLDDAISAYSKVLAEAPLPTSYLGRAFAYRRKGNAAAAQKDRTEANSLMPGIEAEFAGYGLKFDEPLPAKTNAVTTKKVD
jgi:tetratricopeptide (TPR) repeat protein